MRNAKLYPQAARRPLAPRLILGIFAALSLVWAVSAPAAVAALAAAEAVQWPVWVDRDGVRQPLAAGEVLRGRDRVSTGSGGRALLRLADGSGVKLGENAQLDIASLGKVQGGVLEATLNVARGAFRFTTGLFKGPLAKRSVAVNVATITAGIRGTDVWGKSDGERDLVCLLEGRISVSHPKAAEAQVMDQPRSFYTANRGQAPGPVSSVDAEQIARWAQETEIQPGQGVGRSGGAWQIRVAKADSQSGALAILDEIRAQGVAARIRPVQDGDATVYEIRVRHLASEAEARALASRLAAALKLSDVRVSR